MSSLKEMIKNLKNEKERESWKDTKKTTVSFRLENFPLFCLDEVAKELGGSRSSTAASILTSSLFDCLDALGRDPESIMKDYTKSLGQGFFVDGLKVDNVEDFMANPEKYIHPDRIGKMTEEEEEIQRQIDEQEKK